MNLQCRTKPGDLIFYRVTPSSSLFDKIVGILQLLRGEGKGATQYSHVAIVDRDTNYCIEARWPRVRRALIDWNHPELELWRRPLGSAQAAVMLLMARNMVGDRYDLIGLIFGALGSRHRAICTTLVRKVFASIDIEIGAGAGKILTPSELVADPALHHIGQNSHDTSR